MKPAKPDTSQSVRFLSANGNCGVSCIETGAVILSKKMSTNAIRDEKTRDYIRRLGNPYASLSIFGEQADNLDQRRVEFRKLENPHAHHYFFGEPNDEKSNTIPKQALIEFDAEPQPQKKTRPPEQLYPTPLEKQLEEVFQLYRPHISRNDWRRVDAYRKSFLERASRTPQIASRVVSRLEKLKFSLMPDEKVEFNRAPVEKILSELEKLLG